MILSRVLWPSSRDALWVEARYCHQVTPRTLLNREYLTSRLAQGMVVSYCGGRCGALVMHIYHNLLHTVNSEVKRSIGFRWLPSAVQAQPGLLQAWLGSKLRTPICPPQISPRIYTFLTGAFSDYKMPENRQKPEKSHPWFTEIEYMLFFTGQQETEQCLLQQVNMLYRTVVFVDKLIQPWAVQDAAY